jgi:hypothetical protein
MKTKLLVITLVLFISWLYVFLHSHPIAWPLGSEIVKPGLSVCNVEKVKQKMFYHGTLIAQRDLETGEWFFYRKGERCNLMLKEVNK